MAVVEPLHPIPNKMVAGPRGLASLGGLNMMARRILVTFG